MGEPAKSTYKRLAHAVRRLALKAQHLDKAEQIAKHYSYSPIVSRVLAARGFEVGEVLDQFIEPTLKGGIPHPSALKGLKQACEMIEKVVEEGGAIAIACDFDVDGLSGGSQVHHFFRSIGVQSRVFVPDRFEDGYGLNVGMIEEIAKDKFSLLITIDYGTTNIKELTLARELGLKTIVVDHHHVGDHKPPADVFINPQQKGCGFGEGMFCAAGLAWYLVIALSGKLEKAKENKIDPKHYLDLACLGTICDMVPLRGPNRVIARRGLERLSETDRPGLRALKDVAGIRGVVSCHHISFALGPRINAAGRMVHGESVIELLTTTDSIVASKIAQRLNRLNLERQETEAKVKARAVEMLEHLGELPYGIVLANDDFHTGVIGIVAQRMVESYYRPAAILGKEDDATLKGSVRGVKGVSVVEILGETKDHLIKFGGHAGAGGFSLKRENLAAFTEAFNRACKDRLTEELLHPVAEADTEVTLADLDSAVIKELKRFTPFGVGNPHPQLLLKGLKVKEAKIIKNTHLKIKLTDGSRYVSGMIWRMTDHPVLVPGATVNIVCRAEESEYAGVREIAINIQAAEKA